MDGDHMYSCCKSNFVVTINHARQGGNKMTGDRVKLIFLMLIAGFFLAGSAQATTWDFNDGTTQGWTVDYNTGAGSSASWNSGVNYGGAADLGRPPVYGPMDDDSDLTGAISGTPGSMNTGGAYTISSFVSSVFAGQEMDSISAWYIVSGQENGINESVGVWGRIGYSTTADDASYYFSDFIALDTEFSTPGSVYPLWTQLTMAVADGVLVNQIFVNIYVDGSTNFGGTQHWIDQIETHTDGQGPGPVPEPSTIALLGFGLLGLAKVSRKSN